MDAAELARLRSRLNLSRAQLAERLGVTEVAVWRWEKGERRVPEPAARLLRLFVAQPKLMDAVMAPTKPHKRGGR